jgi:hypothetical protein
MEMPFGLKLPAGRPPRGGDVYIEEEFDEQRKSLGFFVKTKTTPPKTIAGPFANYEDASDWCDRNGYRQVPAPP